MDNFYSHSCELLDKGMAKVVSLLNDIASNRVDCSHMQLTIATHDDPHLKRCMEKAEYAWEERKKTIAAIASFEIPELDNRMIEGESAVQQGIMPQSLISEHMSQTKSNQ